MRIGAVCFAVLLAAPVSIPASMPAFAAKELKPKYGDIGGITYSDVSGNWDSCLAALERKISLCM